MGIDLTLSPAQYGSGTSSDLADTRVSLDRDYALFDQIKALPSWLTRFPLYWYGDDGVNLRSTDPYGDPLRYVCAVEFAAIKPADDATAWNRAAIAFLAALPPDTRVYLWWH